MAETQEIEVYVEEPRRYSIARVIAPFNKGKKAVESARGGKFRIPSTCLNQQAREERGYQDDVSRNGNWVREGVYRQKENNVLTSTGLAYLHPDEAVLAHSNGKEYTLEACTQDEIEKAIAEGLIILPEYLDENGNLKIPCSDFGSNQYGLFFFGGKGTDKEKSDRAKASGAWLINSPEKTTEVVVYLDGEDYSRKIGKDYANQMWFRGLGYRSELNGDRDWSRYLHYGNRVLGVFDNFDNFKYSSVVAAPEALTF